MATASSDLAALLDDPGRRAAAAMALGRRGAREYADRIAAALPNLEGRDRTAFAVALEQLGDPAVVPALLPQAGDWDVHHALTRLTGRDPLVADARDPDARLRAWANVDLTVEAKPAVRVTAIEPARAAFELDEGLGRLRIDYDPPVPDTQWPRWSRSLQINGEPVYGVGSLCGTCETTIALTGWPAARVAEVSARIRTRLADLTALDDDLLEALRPLLIALPTGHYRVYLLDLDLEPATDPDESWWQRRITDRGEERNEFGSWPGDHLQLRTPIPGPVRTYGVVLPTHALRTEETVATHRAAIDAGRRPAALLWGWVEQKYVEMEHLERFLIGVTLDGHHRLAAYAAAGVPARAVLVARLEDCWGEDPDRFLTEAVTPLLAQR